MAHAPHPHAPARRRWIPVCALGALALTLAACSPGTPSTGTAAPSTTTTTASGGATSTSGTAITIANFAFTPRTLSVAPGAKVLVTNDDSVAHTLTADDGRFNTGPVQPGQTVSFNAPTRPGPYPYHCTIHTFMTGTLRVR